MPIPKEHACKKMGGEDLSIPIEFKNIPENTKSFALIIDDPDAIPVAGKISVHWVVIDIPPSDAHESVFTTTVAVPLDRAKEHDALEE